MSQDVRKYLEEESALANALAHKWLGVDAGEAGKTGEAVGYLKWAKGELEALKEGKLAKFKKGGGGGDVKMKKERSVEELESVSTFLKNYQKVNDSVSCTYTLLKDVGINDMSGSLSTDPSLFGTSVFNPSRHTGRFRKGIRAAPSGFRTRHTRLRRAPH